MNVQMFQVPVAHITQAWLQPVSTQLHHVSLIVLSPCMEEPSLYMQSLLPWHEPTSIDHSQCTAKFHLGLCVHVMVFLNQDH
jgi:hypothetical protein